MIITLELLLRDDDAGTIRDALDAIANKLSDVGYDPGEFTTVRDPDGKMIPYRVVRGIPMDRHETVCSSHYDEHDNPKED